MATMKMGRHSYGNPQIISFRNDANLTIGAFCSIADCFIFLGGEHRTDWISTFPFSAFDMWGAGHIPGVPKTKGNVVIGNDVWIGHHAVIMSGVTIGDGACIGAFSIVARDVLPYTVVAGNPARFIRKRFNDYEIEFLIKLRWWDWPDERIKQAAPLLMSDNLDGLRAFSEKGWTEPVTAQKQADTSKDWRHET
jgi:chloramphenicol O-acetyltransferase type B